MALTLLEPKLAILQDRAAMLAHARRFFSERGLLEVDCPIVSRHASVDAHIDLIETNEGRYLHSSPEYGMKRLLAAGMPDIYQLSHVFRKGESSDKHNPEFMMAEWYRLHTTFEAIMEETCQFIRLFIGPQPVRITTYREVFKQYAGFDYCSMDTQQLFDYLESKGISPHAEALEEGRDGLLNIILGSFIEPFLGNEELLVLAYYPASQAALAKKCQREDEEVCERFEIYYQGLELANGYHELTDEQEQRKRLLEENEQRERLGKAPLPIDELFLDALKQGLPDCCGVAVGFDRLMMLRHGVASIHQVTSFNWDNA
jgi:lysyl-tRNA synthetase class 2